MPLYEYECSACGHRFERIRKFSDPPVEECPNCGKKSVQKLMSSPAIQFKGSGWYINDYARASKDSKKESGKESRESGKESRESGKESRESGKESKESGKESRESGESKESGKSKESTESSKESKESKPVPTPKASGE